MKVSQTRLALVLLAWIWAVLVTGCAEPVEVQPGQALAPQAAAPSATASSSEAVPTEAQPDNQGKVLVASATGSPPPPPILLAHDLPQDGLPLMELVTFAGPVLSERVADAGPPPAPVGRARLTDQQ